MMAVLRYLLAFSTLTLGVLADSYTWKKCFCTDNENFGYTTNHTWYRDGSEKPTWWSHHDYLSRDKAIKSFNQANCPADYGIQCDGLSCWVVPNAYCYQTIMKAADEPHWDVPCVYGKGWKGGKICGTRDFIDYDGKRIFASKEKKEKKQNRQVKTELVSCVVECKRAWPERNMKSACSYKYHNEKSSHHGEDVSVGYSMEKDGKVKVYKNPPGKASMCVEVHYPAFGT